MKSSVLALAVTLTLAATACGGGSGSAVPGPGGGSSTLAASFSAEQANPGANSVNMMQASANANLVTVRIGVTDVTGVYGAAFDVLYDSNTAEFVNWSAGSLLEQDGQTSTYQVGNVQPGRIVVGVVRQGNVSGADASGTEALIHLTFRVTEEGAAQVGFQNTALYDDQPAPQTIPGISWFAGSLVGN